MRKRTVVLVLGVAVGCEVADPNSPAVPVGGSGGTSSAGVSSAGNGGVAPNGGAAGTGNGTAGRSGAPAEAGAGGQREGSGEGGAAGEVGAPSEGGAGGEAGADGGDGCTPACSATQTCVLGACKDQDCAPSATFCAGSSLRTCAGDGLSSVQVTSCGADKYCDPASVSCKQGFTMCPNIYLGSGRFGANPRPASQANDAIVLNSYDITVNTVVAGQVRVNNLGTDDSPTTHLELYLSESPAFATNQNRLILQNDAVVPGAAQGGAVGEYTINWSYTFPTVGHYVLLARVDNNSPPTGAACTKQGYDTSAPTTDAQTAVHYLNVVP